MQGRGLTALALSMLIMLGALTLNAAEPPCGAPGKPACPLQAWIRSHAAAPLATKNFTELETRFEQIAKLNPDPAKWGNWTKIAKDGARAAREKREGGVRETCGRCHGAYRRAYNARYRLRLIATD